MKAPIKITNKIKWEKYYNIYHQYDWYLICRNEKLSEEFMEEFSNRLDWNCIFWYQPLTKSFIKKFKHKFNLNRIEKAISKFGLSIYLTVQFKQNMSKLKSLT